MRIIHEIIRTLIKLLLRVDTESPMIELEMDEEQKANLIRWCRMIDDGDINEAENELFALLEDKCQKNLQSALQFYAYLNEKDDEFLSDHNYSREEIMIGLENIASKCGMQSIIEMFLK